LAGIQGLLQRIKNVVRPHRAAHLPAHDASGEHVDDEGHIQPALPGRDVNEVADPLLVWPLGPTLPVDPIQRIRGLGISDGGAYALPRITPRKQIVLKQDREMGRFLVGSTVVMLFPKRHPQFRGAWKAGAPIRLDDSLTPAWQH